MSLYKVVPKSKFFVRKNYQTYRKVGVKEEFGRTFYPIFGVGSRVVPKYIGINLKPGPKKGP